MNLGYFTMPIHPLGKDWKLSSREDREAFLLADELGFIEAYVGEHVTDQAENITSGIAFQPDEVTLESICDKLIIYGTPERVADRVLAFQDEVGKFGTLLYAGKAGRTRSSGAQSMILMAEKVMPRVNAATSKQSSAAE
jgi:hypothetical protein